MGATGGTYGPARCSFALGEAWKRRLLRGNARRQKLSLAKRVRGLRAWWLQKVVGDRSDRIKQYCTYTVLYLACLSIGGPLATPVSVPRKIELLRLSSSPISRDTARTAFRRCPMLSRLKSKGVSPGKKHALRALRETGS